MTPTLELAEELSRHGFTVTPHLTARLVHDAPHLADVVARPHAADVGSVFIVRGDGAEPAGTITDALSLLVELEPLGHHFRHMGIGAVPRSTDTSARS